MATKAFYISTAKLKERTPLNLNIEDQLLTMNIWTSQEVYIQPLLGSDLYKKINADVIAGTLSGNYKTLMDDYILPALEQYAMAESLLFIRYKIMNKSVLGQNSDNSAPVEQGELKYITGEIKNRAKFYAERLTGHLMANLTLFPEYTSNDDLDDMQPETSAYFCGIQLDDDGTNLCEYMAGNYRRYWL